MAVSKDQFDGNKGAEVKIDVPDHILDMIPIAAETYIKDNYDRALGAANGMSADEFDRVSTHNIVNTPERRELHRAILQEVAERGLKGERPEKPIFISFVGPMGVGKTRLRDELDMRMAEEGADGGTKIYVSEDLEEIYQKYKQASLYKVDSDFSLYKARLPEFEQNGKNFGVVRAEASALDSAVIAWSKELGSSLIIEQSGFGSDVDWCEERARNYEWIGVGVTNDPIVNAAGLNARSQSTGQDITMSELSQSVIDFSVEGHFDRMCDFADRSFLFDAGADYEVIAKWNRGLAFARNVHAYNKFMSYADLDRDELAARMESEIAVKPAVSHDSEGPK